MLTDMVILPRPDRVDLLCIVCEQVMVVDPGTESPADRFHAHQCVPTLTPRTMEELTCAIATWALNHPSREDRS